MKSAGMVLSSRELNRARRKARLLAKQKSVDVTDCVSSSLEHSYIVQYHTYNFQLIQNWIPKQKRSICITVAVIYCHFIPHIYRRNVIHNWSSHGTVGLWCINIFVWQVGEDGPERKRPRIGNAMTGVEDSWSDDEDRMVVDEGPTQDQQVWHTYIHTCTYCLYLFELFQCYKYE